jgi:hypothetical protein
LRTLVEFVSNKKDDGKRYFDGGAFGGQKKQFILSIGLSSGIIAILLAAISKS